MGPHQPHSPLSYTPFSIPEQQQKGNSIDFSLYQQTSPPPSAYPFSSSSSVPLNLANQNHHPHPGPNGSGGNSLAGALSSSLPIQSSAIVHHSASPGSTGSLGPFATLPPYAVGGPSNPSSTSPTTGNPGPLSHTHPHVHPPSATIPTAALSPQDKQALIANEKRRRRRESHNAVERRRRDNINEKISELATLIPECMLEGGNVAPSNNGGSVSPSMESHPSFLDGADPLLPVSLSAMKKDDIGRDDGDQAPSTPTSGLHGESGIVKANKGMILRKSVEYIRSVFYTLFLAWKFLIVAHRYLQQLVTAQGARNRELEQELKAYRSGGAPTSTSSPASSGPSILALGTGDSSSTLTLNANAANTHTNINGKRRQNSTRSIKSIKRNAQAKGGSPSDQSAEGDDLDEKDLPLLPDEHDHDHDESSDPEGEYEDDLGDNGHFGGMLGGMAGMSGMVLADEGMRLEFSGAQHGQKSQTSVAGARGRRTARRTSSTSLGNNVNSNQHHPIHSSHQQHPHTMQNVQGMNMNMNLAMFPDGLGMSVPVSVPAGLTTDVSMEVDPREHDAQSAAAAAAAIERGRSSTRPGTGAGHLGGFVGNGRANGHPNGSNVTLTTGNPNGVRLKEEMVDVGVTLGLGSNMGMGMGMLSMGMSA